MEEVREIYLDEFLKRSGKEFWKKFPEDIHEKIPREILEKKSGMDIVVGPKETSGRIPVRICPKKI